MNTSDKKFSSIILAGGEGKRVDGRDKGLINYKDKPLIQHVIEAVTPQTDEIIISANRNREGYESYGYKVVTDTADEYRGPLAGITAALPYCKNDWVFVAPCDMPFLPGNIIDTLCNEITTHDLCIAETENRLQLVFLLNKSLLPSLIVSLQNDQLRLMQWVKSQNFITHSFTESPYFKNFNHTKDLA